MPPTIEKTPPSSDIVDGILETIDEEKLGALEQALELFALGTDEAARLALLVLAALGVDLDYDAPLDLTRTEQAGIKVGFRQCTAPADGTVENTEDLAVALEGEEVSDIPEGVDERLFNHYVSLGCDRIQQAISMLMGDPDTEFTAPRIKAAKAALEHLQSLGKCEG